MQKGQTFVAQPLIQNIRQIQMIFLFIGIQNARQFVDFIIKHLRVSPADGNNDLVHQILFPRKQSTILRIYRKSEVVVTL